MKCSTPAMSTTARPRVLVLASTFPRWHDDTEPRFVEFLSYELADSFDIVVLAPHCKGALRRETFTSGGRSIEVQRYRYGPAAIETLAYDGGMLFRVRRNPLRLLVLPIFVLMQAIAARRLHRKYRFDAVHAHWIIPQGFVAALLQVLTPRFPPVLVTSHGGDLYALQGPFLARLKRWILTRADAVTVVSTAMRDYCENHLLLPGKVTVRSMGVDLEHRFTPGESPRAREGLVFVGRLVDKKGVAHLVRALALLSEAYPQLQLTIVGDGPLRQSLVEFARSQGVFERVHFVGSVASEDVPRYLRAASIAVMPSVVAASGDQEGLGLVAVEAMGCGCAVVASDLPAVREAVIDGRTGLMARPGDPADLAGKISALLDDDVLCRSLADSGRAHALENFNWPEVGSEYAKIIIRLIGNAT